MVLHESLYKYAQNEYIQYIIIILDIQYLFPDGIDNYLNLQSS